MGSFPIPTFDCSHLDRASHFPGSSDTKYGNGKHLQQQRQPWGCVHVPRAEQHGVAEDLPARSPAERWPADSWTFCFKATRDFCVALRLGHPSFFFKLGRPMQHLSKLVASVGRQENKAHAKTNLKHHLFSHPSLQHCFPAPRSCGPRRAGTRDWLGAATNMCHELRSPHGLVSGTRGGWLWAAEAAGDPGTTRRVQHFAAWILTPPCWLAWPRLK
ncbi:uncharacterized protein ACIBXB_002483 [Morphnus guianensis]